MNQNLLLFFLQNGTKEKSGRYRGASSEAQSQFMSCFLWSLVVMWNNEAVGIVSWLVCILRCPFLHESLHMLPKRNSCFAPSTELLDVICSSLPCVDVFASSGTLKLERSLLSVSVIETFLERISFSLMSPCQLLKPSWILMCSSDEFFAARSTS